MTPRAACVKALHRRLCNAASEVQGMADDRIRVLAVASGGGHWEQLMLLRPTLANYDIRFATTEPAVALQHGVTGAETLPDCNQNMPLQSALCAIVALGSC